MKFIPIQLQQHYDQDGITTCLLSRFKLKDGRVFGLTDLDVDVEYDPAAYDPGNTGDDWGPIIHKADNGGFTISAFEAAADLTVDNAELEMLPGMPNGLTAPELLAGVLDSAEVHIYRVNYMDLSMGHECIAKGRLGNTRVSKNRGYLEFRSLTDLLKQPEAHLVTVTCPKIFGDASTGCPKAYVWTDFEVTAVDVADSKRVFSTDISPADDYYVPGVVQWTEGANASSEDDVEQNTGGTFALALPAANTIQIGDKGRVRQDCTKLWDDANKGCLYHWDDQRFRYFGGFPDTPTADSGSLFVPGAQVNARRS